ncbi:aldehyde dehydrogenase family protein [Sphingomonas nostoxanthinifaciens]|uniref:aldehyde dehydrogenase family protein n=1 Tax=Sphingomonas nostoxanthinifaciens TaxID=2872652 RepID=UPI001CC20826|nr:aldehyde dehydrogenase family protein [Sphingomonas nostoxanthinifaciens]UAK26322.1 aldehyde dehydrogenase family protein [Sphingomonas nostoxanthinifaciens]
MADVSMLIDGALVDGERDIDVVNPALAEPFATAPVPSDAQLDQAVAAAKAAYPAWAATSVAEREAALHACGDILEANADMLARILTQEQGKPLVNALREVNGSAATFRRASGKALADRTSEDADGRRIVQRRRPLGVVVTIVAWNFPLSMMVGKIAAALVAGNTVVAKPAPTTPLTTLRAAMLIAEALPKGVLNVVGDDGTVGPKLTSHPDVRRISFTGSTATGRKVMANAADTLKRLTLELGGNDAALVLDDCNPKEVAGGLFTGAFGNSGQICVAIKRAYVPDALYDDVCDELATLCEGAIVGDGLEQGTQFGPLQNKAQFDRVRGLIDDAAQHGTIMGDSGTLPEHGYFIRPQIVRDISDGTRLVDEEQFGPVLPVIRYEDPEDALARANASPYGLGGSVWSTNPERARSFAERMESGSVWINRHPDLAHHIPFAGANQSGFGVEYADEGLEEFTQIQVITARV